MIRQVESGTILVDSSKFGKRTSFEVCSLNRVVNLVCYEQSPDKIKHALIKAGVNIFCVAL